MNMLHAIDFHVLVLLASIMVVNHIVVHLKETKRIIDYLQRLVKLNPVRGFWMISFAAFIVSPFLTNDGVCLLFVEPILNAFELESDDAKEVERDGA
jgi:Na+/H+ antiporter NhaD/arsenite permease-like protein